MVKTEKKAAAIDKRIDLRGEVCPYTFVKSKLALEMMRPGHILEVLVDYLPSTENVPRSAANEGHEVLAVTQVNETDWIIIIQKRGKWR